MSGDGEINYVGQDQIHRDHIITEWNGVKRWKKYWGFLLPHYEKMDNGMKNASLRDGDKEFIEIDAVDPHKTEPLRLPGDVMFWRQIGSSFG